MEQLKAQLLSEISTETSDLSKDNLHWAQLHLDAGRCLADHTASCPECLHEIGA
jgi:hypothetical protein